MKRFSTWLVSEKNTKYSALSKQLNENIRTAAKSYYTSTVPAPTPGDPNRRLPLHLARGKARLTAETLVRDLGNLLQDALVTYWTEVVKPNYDVMPPAAKKALSIEWDMLLHAPGKQKLADLKSFIDAIDKFSKHYLMKKSFRGAQLTIWEGKTIVTPEESKDGFIPEIGSGYTDAYSRGPDQPHLGEPGEVVLEAESRERFEKGSPGAAWVGVLVNRHRAGIPKCVAYLVPALHMEKHLSLPHGDAIGVKPVEQWGAAGHHEATVRLISQRRIVTDNWHRTEYNPDGKLKNANEGSYCGVLMGFAIVKAYNAIGHQWAFISGTLNKTGTDNWVKGDDGLYRAMREGNDFLMPKKWAVAVWKATNNLEGNIYVAPGKFVRHWLAPVEAQAIVPPPPRLPRPSRDQPPMTTPPVK